MKATAHLSRPTKRRRAFLASVGGLHLTTVRRLLSEVREATDVVAFTLAEHLPWDAINLHDVLEAILP